MTISRKIAWTMWMTASIFYAYQYILRVMPNIMLEDIMSQFQMDAALFGQYSGIYYIGYALMHIPIGIALDRYGPRIIMTACILLTVIGMLPVLVSDFWAFPIMGRLFMGIGSSAAILGTFKIIRIAFHEKQFTRMLSISVSIGLLGAIYGGGPVRQMCDALGYKTVIQIFATVGLVLAAITYFIVPKLTAQNRRPIYADLKTVLTNPRVIAICLSAGFFVGPLEGFADVWASEFLKQVYGYDGIVAGYMPSLIFAGMCFGAPLLSFIAEKSGSYLGAIIGAGAIMLVTFVALLNGWLTINSMTIGFLIVGVCCAYQVIAIYKASTYVPENVAGLTTAIANMIIMIFGYALHTTMGLVIDIYGGAHVTQAFVYGVSVIPVALGIGLCGFLILAFTEKNILVQPKPAYTL